MHTTHIALFYLPSILAVATLATVILYHYVMLYTFDCTLVNELVKAESHLPVSVTPWHEATPHLTTKAPRRPIAALKFDGRSFAPTAIVAL
jgi:hypothetical protein